MNCGEDVTNRVMTASKSEQDKYELLNECWLVRENDSPLVVFILYQILGHLRIKRKRLEKSRHLGLVEGFSGTSVQIGLTWALIITPNILNAYSDHSTL